MSPYESCSIYYDLLISRCIFVVRGRDRKGVIRGPFQGTISTPACNNKNPIHKG